MDSVEGWSLGRQSHSIRPITLLSSVGGFSRPAVDGIRTLQDLLRSIQPLKLRRYEGSQLQDHNFLGEGVTYSVSRSWDVRDGELVAVKTVKLPAAPAPLSTFRGRIECILKDVEVMHHLPLMEHPNIINLLGYGWELKGDGPLPFIVTEYASLGTLREYLTTESSDARSRRELCYHVASGLHELHLSGVAHGDLKLENVLVVFAEPDIARGRQVPVLAKLSDFGHSLRFATGTNLEGQKYCGTIWYNPPEVMESNTITGKIEVRKCDMWALGLLCWEIHRKGTRYYEDRAIQELLSSAEPQDVSIGTASDGPRSANMESTKVLCQKLRNISAFVAMEACHWVDKVPILDKSWQHFDRILLKGVLKNTLCADPSRRMENVSRLPLIHGKNELRERSLLIERRAEEAEWTFALFLETQFTHIPSRVKSEMLADFERVAYLTTDSTKQSARAALQVVFALTASFGATPPDPEALNFWISKSTREPFTMGLLIEELLRQQLCGMDSGAPCGTKNYTDFLRLAIRTHARSEFSDLEDIVSIDTFAKLKDAVQLKSNESVVAHYAVVHQLTHLLPASFVNIRSSFTGETPLLLACRLGDYEAAQELLDRGADASISTSDGCLPLHWLFLFDDPYIKMIMPRLLGFDAINKAASRPQMLDAQLPADFEGSPLAFAVAAASLTTVDALLDCATTKVNAITMKEACCRATSLHLDSMLRKMLPVFMRLTLGPDVCESYLDLGDLARSSVVIKKILHGKRVDVACDNTVRLLMDKYLDQVNVSRKYVDAPPSYMESEGKPATISGLCSRSRTRTTSYEVEGWLMKGLQASIQAGQLRIAQVIIRIFEQKYESTEFALSSWFGAGISQICIETACRSMYNFNTSIHILDFAAQICSRCDFANHWTASVIAAIQYHREDIILSLFCAPQDLNAQCGEGNMILHTLLRFNFVDVLPLQTLLSLGADPNAHDRMGFTPLHIAIQLGMVAEIDTLLAHGADVSKADSNQNTPLHLAIEYGRVTIVSQLLRNPFCTMVLSASDAYQRSPLALAALKGASEIFRLLIDAGANDMQTDENGRTPLHLAATRSEPGHLAIIRDLLTRPEQVDHVDCDNNTALHLAITALAPQSNPSIKACECLLTASANPNSKNSKGESCTFLTLQLLDEYLINDLLPILIKCGADINSSIQGPYCALHITAFHGQASLVEILLKNGAFGDVLIPEIIGTPLQCCAIQRFTIEVQGNAVGSVVECGTHPDIDSDIDYPDIDSNILKCFHWKAFTYPQPNTVVKRLISAGADILANYHTRGIPITYTPLVLAVSRYEWNSYGDIVRMLMRLHQIGLSGPLGARHLEVLQEAFDIAARNNLDSLVHYVLMNRIPVEKSYLCTLDGLEHLFRALSNKEITARYKESQELLVPLRPGSLQLVLKKNMPSLWTEIKASGIVRRSHSVMGIPLKRREQYVYEVMDND